MNIVIDDKIPYIRGVFEPYGEVHYIAGGSIHRDHLTKADCLLVRTRTICNQKLLEGSSVRFVGTATIGFDHIDTDWCESNGIFWANAPGCNSGAVAQYIRAALLEMANRRHFNLADQTLGIIGVGHVGKKVERQARDLGMRVLLCDPPRERVEGNASFTSLESLLSTSEIITIHVPLNRQGIDKTLNLVGSQFINALNPGTILINSSRGEVLNETEVLDSLKSRGDISLVLDVWPHEPEINLKLLELTAIATPHIAGYSVEGKYNATMMVVKAVRQHFGLPLDPISPLANEGPLQNLKMQAAAYDIMADDKRLRKSPETFEQQRNNYPQRWEYEKK
jgi:erythronate-4-phosphate dehydrogenase